MKCALFTSGINVDYLNVTVPFMEAYCEKYSLDFILNQENKIPNFNDKVTGAFERFAIYDLLETYDRVLYLDCDIIIKKNSPNIFDIVPENQFGVYYETDNFGRGHFIDGLKIKYNYSGITRYFNNGVLVVSKTHKPLFEMQKVEEFFKKYKCNKLADMDYQNIIIHKNNIPTCSIGYKFNYFIKPWILRKFELSHFVHFAGVHNKKVVMKKFLLEHSCNN